MKHQFPASWITSPFRDVAEVITGTTPSTQYPEYYGGSVPFVGPAELGGAEPITQSSKRLSPAGVKQARLLPAESVLVCCIGATIGKVGFAGTELATNQQINALIFNKSIIYPRYAFHYCRTLESLIRHTGASTTLPILPKGRFQELEISFPPLEEQRRIAAILDKADAVRRKRKEAIALTEELLRSAFLNLVGTEHPAYHEWPEVSLGKLALPKKGSMRTGPFGSTLLHSEFVDQGIAVLGIDNAVQNRFAWSERRFITPEKYEGLKQYTVKPGDVIITIMGTIGRSAVVPEDIPTAINTKHLAAITLDRSKALPEYLSNAIHRDPFVLHQIALRNRGAIMAGLNLGIIKELKVRLPPLEQQVLYDKVVKQTRQEQKKLEKAANTANELFNSLLQRAFRGEL